MKIELKNIADIKPYPNNPRINDDAVDAVVASIREFGFRQPIVVDTELVIVCGHTRYKAALKLGLKKVPVHIAKDLTPEQIKAYRIADNKTAELAEWNYDLLPIELGELQALNYDMTLLGFDPDDLAQLLDPGVTEGLVDPDDVPEPPDEAITQLGDLWILGNHRLLCADSSKPEDVDRLLDGAAIHRVHTDPPFNVRGEPRSHIAIAAGLSSFSNDAAAKKLKAGQGNASFDVARGKKKAGNEHHQKFDLARHPEKAKPTQKKMRAKDRPLANDFVSDEEFDRLLMAWFGNIARVLLPGHGFYVWGGYANVANYPPVFKRCAMYFSQAVIWHKMHPVLTRKDFMGDHEWCFYGWREGAAHRYFGPNNVPDVWSIKKVNPQSMIHLTEKPVELAVRAIQYSSLAGENVLDLFGGSGSTLIACEQTGRKAFLMELDPPYCDVIVQRWEKFTGKKAQRVEAVVQEASA